MKEAPITVEVAYALADRQEIVELQVPCSTTAFQAVELSRIADLFPEIDPETADIGIFGRMLGVGGLMSAREYQLQPGDRVEVYRPLIADPRQVRKQRAAKARAGKAD